MMDSIYQFNALTSRPKSYSQKQNRNKQQPSLIADTN